MTRYLLQVSKTSLRMLLVMSILTGIVYPLGVNFVVEFAFRSAASGSLIEVDGQQVGSEWVGQPFDGPQYFWGRPSATSPVPYNGLGGSGSNQGPTNPALIAAIRERVARLRAADPEQQAKIPIDLVTASASGLDPHISPAAAEFQVARVARQRGLKIEGVRTLIQLYTSGPTFGIFGQARVHVLRLNMALDAMAGADQAK